MTNQLQLFDDNLEPYNKTPLPIVVSQKWDFPLQRYETSAGVLYSVIDWIVGIGNSDQFRATDTWNRITPNITTLKIVILSVMQYQDIHGNNVDSDFVNDVALYRIAQELRSTKARPALESIKQYLAKAGAFVDKQRLEQPKQISKKYRKLQKTKELYDKAWVENEYMRERLQLQMDVIETYTMLQSTVKSIVENPNYGVLTNKEYMNLFGAGAKQLKEQLQSKHIRDELSNIALSTLRHAETTLANILRISGNNITMQQATAIYDHVLAPIGNTHLMLCEQFGINPISGKPLLTSGKS